MPRARLRGDWSARLLVLVCALTAAAGSAQTTTGQRQTTTGQRTAQPPASPPRRYVSIGCLTRQGQPPRYILTDRRGEQPIVYRLEGDQSQLSLHVGHTVEVAGTMSAAPAGAKGPNANAPVLKAASLVWISNSCSR
jgi:hypothetical protein